MLKVVWNAFSKTPIDMILEKLDQGLGFCHSIGCSSQVPLAWCSRIESRP